MPIHVTAIEDHPLWLKAVVEELEGKPDIKLVGTMNHGSKLMTLLYKKIPDAVTLDLGMSTQLAVRTVSNGERLYTSAVLDKLLSNFEKDNLNNQEQAGLFLVAKKLRCK